HDLKSHQIEVAEDLQAEGSVPLSPDLLQTVIHHLLKNSLWALTRPDVPNRLLTVRSGSLGEKLFLDVEDSGIGVSQELQSRIFDPFFTTHRPGEGVGLGLSVSRKTAREAGGDLLCCNVQKGALFRLTLPLHKE
ncbi:MAG TPA: HAMP domain-containing histidine kinase, partial [Phycisphaerales bacterium]|nr:HAMP domain-containing histidine kinase [Phycisphaerales bacterium]